MDRQEMVIDDFASKLGMVMGHTMQAKEELHVVRELCEVTAVRVQALTKDFTLEAQGTADTLKRLRIDTRQLKEAKRLNPRQSQPDALTTDQREAISLEQAQALIKAEADKREQAEEIERLKAENARLQKKDADEEAEKKESRRYWARTVTGWVAIIVTGVVVIYVGYRLTKPDVTQTIEYSQPKGPNSGK